MRFAILLPLLATAAPVLAQPVPPPGNIDDRTRQQLRPLTDRDRADAIMTGDTDVLLLQRTKLFTLTGSFDLTTTSNAALSPVTERPDTFGQAQLGLAVGTRIGGKVDVFASASLVGVRYFSQTALDYSALSGVVGARVALGRISVTGTYQPSIVYNRDFSVRQLTSHRFRLGASAGFRLRGIAVEPEIHGERAITHPGDYSAWSGGGSLTLSGPVPTLKNVLLYAQAGYDRRSFDDYFTAFVGVKRIDDNLGASVGAVWRPRPWADIRASYSFARNWSTSDVNGYVAHSGTLGVSASLRF